jgi:hypothetical protein
MFHYGNVYLHNKKSDLVIQTLWIIHKFYTRFNTTLALYLLEIKMHNGFHGVHMEFLKIDLLVFPQKNLKFFGIFFSSVYSTNFASFLGEISPNFRYKKVEKQNPCWCTKVYWKRNEMKKASFFCLNNHTFDTQTFEY